MINEKVSVIIPIYNSEKFLSEAIESVLNQSYTDLEIIVIDDGSTDDSLKILEKYSDKITILSQTNEGLTSALNLGIKKMNGHWFKWFSPDDILYPEAIEILVHEVPQYDFHQPYNQQFHDFLYDTLRRVTDMINSEKNEEEYTGFIKKWDKIESLKKRKF